MGREERVRFFRLRSSCSRKVDINPWYDPLSTSFLRMAKVRVVLLRGLQSFPAEPGMLCMLLDAEHFSSSQQRLVHHLSEVRPRVVVQLLYVGVPLRSCRESVLTARGGVSFAASVKVFVRFGGCVLRLRILPHFCAHAQSGVPAASSDLGARTDSTGMDSVGDIPGP